MMKVRLFVFLFMLAEVAFVPVHVFAGDTAETTQSEKKEVVLKTRWEKKKTQGRSASARVSGYIEHNQLFLSFSVLIDNVYLQIADVTTGCILFAERVSGDSFVVPLLSDASAFELLIDYSNTDTTYEE